MGWPEFILGVLNIAQVFALAYLTRTTQKDRNGHRTDGGAVVDDG